MYKFFVIVFSLLTWRSTLLHTNKHVHLIIQ